MTDTQMHVMVDIETLGTSPGSVIVSIGAVAFEPVRTWLGAEFYVEVDIVNAQRAGLSIDASTVAWWAQQGQSARDALSSKRAQPLNTALHLFAVFVQENCGVGSERLWGHGANFDVVLLEAAYRLFGNGAPWSHRAPRDTRTIFDLAEIDLKDFSAGVEHNALDDARCQAMAVIAAYKKLGLQNFDDPASA